MLRAGSRLPCWRQSLSCWPCVRGEAANLRRRRRDELGRGRPQDPDRGGAGCACPPAGSLGSRSGRPGTRCPAQPDHTHRHAHGWNEHADGHKANATISDPSTYRDLFWDTVADADGHIGDGLCHCHELTQRFSVGDTFGGTALDDAHIRASPGYRYAVADEEPDTRRGNWRSGDAGSTLGEHSLTFTICSGVGAGPGN